MTAEQSTAGVMDEKWISRLLLESGNFVVVIVDDKGKIQRFSKGAAALVQCAPEEAINRHLWDMVPEKEDREKLRRMFVASARRRSFPAEYEIHWQSDQGRDVWLRVAVNDMVQGENNDYYLFIGQDVSWRVQTEQQLAAKLREQEFLATLSHDFLQEGLTEGEKYTQALASLGAFFQIERAFFHTVDAQKRVIDMTYEYFALGYPPVGMNMDNLPLDLLGMSPESVQATPISYNRAEDYLKKFAHLADFWEQLSSRSHMAQPLIYQGKMLGFISVHDCQKSREWSEEDKRLLQMVADSFQSIYLLNREHNRLNELQELWSFALEGSGEGVWEWDFETGRSVCDDRWKEMLGFHAKLSIETFEDFLRLVHPEDQSMLVNEETRQLMEAGHFAVRFRMEHRRNGYVHILSRGKVMTWSSEGVPKKVVGTHLDITEQVQRELESKEASRYREEFEKVASLGTMVAGVAHEINQPLQAMKMTVDGTLYWERKGKELPREKLLADYQLLSSQIVRIDRIIQRLRKFIVQGRSAIMRETSVNSCVQGAMELVGNQLRSHGVLVESQLEEELPEIWGDPERLEEAIVNLLVNAMQAMDKPGVSKRQVVVRTGLVSVPGDGVYIQVQDTGGGVPQNMLDSLFEPFVSSKIESNARSMGLGLSIVRSTVLAMNGTITVHNGPPPHGACFEMVFPLPQG